jgi:WhiB family transcriptional regulator, redox-sensing transcriptional regulator
VESLLDALANPFSTRVPNRTSSKFIGKDVHARFGERPLNLSLPVGNLGAVPDPATAVLAWLMSPGSGEQLPSLEEFVRRPGWTESAACAGMPIETFFPPRGASTAANARAICARCSVRPECLAYARSFNGTSGVWAGTTERERRRLGVVA